MTPPIEVVDLTHGRWRTRLLSYGAITQGWWYNDVQLILGYETPEDYVTDPYYLGAIVGPVANRVGGAAYVKDGTKVSLPPNEGLNLLHSGVHGLSRQVWNIEKVNDQTARLIRQTDEGEAGFPGRAEYTVTVSLTENRLSYDMRAEVTRTMPISLAQHNYYTLGAASGSDLKLHMQADCALCLSDEQIATGETEDLQTAGFDFATGQQFRNYPNGVDRYVVLDQQRDASTPIARLSAPSGLRMDVYSDQPGAQIYSGLGLGAPFRPGEGVCIEPSGYPNAVNQPHFPSVFCQPDKPYVQKLVLEVSE